MVRAMGTFFAFRRSLAAAALILGSHGAPAGRAAENPEAHWTAEWITAPGVPERDHVVLHFRKVLELASKPASFVVDVSADNQFILYVNGRDAGRGPSRADPAHWRYETYDLAPLLGQGKNLLAATVWQFSTHAAIAQMSDRAGFLVHGRGHPARAADTNAAWEVEEEKGI